MDNSNHGQTGLDSSYATEWSYADQHVSDADVAASSTSLIPALWAQQSQFQDYAAVGSNAFEPNPTGKIDYMLDDSFEVSHLKPDKSKPKAVSASNPSAAQYAASAVQHQVQPAAEPQSSADGGKVCNNGGGSGRPSIPPGKPRFAPTAKGMLILPLHGHSDMTYK